MVSVSKNYHPLDDTRECVVSVTSSDMDGHKLTFSSAFAYEKGQGRHPRGSKYRNISSGNIVGNYDTSNIRVLNDF